MSFEWSLTTMGLHGNDVQMSVLGYYNVITKIIDIINKIIHLTTPIADVLNIYIPVLRRPRRR